MFDLQIKIAQCLHHSDSPTASFTPICTQNLMSMTISVTIVQSTVTSPPLLLRNNIFTVPPQALAHALPGFSVTLVSPSFVHTARS
mmetsp:Transcript_26609/g.36590  ORF Transcript_26609/g.36590 Transcript_26609/m.36590 type:complete len:86 (-) Transcript_26609:705-962(-)